MRPLLLATTNPGKAREFAALLSRHSAFNSYVLTTPSVLGCVLPPVEETGQTFTENAALKAISAARQANLPVLTDDSGLCVDALQGAPGIYSSRWAGPTADDHARMSLLLAQLEAVPATQRTARFVCAVALAQPDGNVLTALGTCEGLITRNPHGTHGFGYDPIFLLPTLRTTLAQLPFDQKNTLSHRANALALLAKNLENLR